MKRGCFLIGLGPSLCQIDITLLKDYHTISFNRSFIAWQEWRFTPSYYAVFDPDVIRDNHEEINRIINSKNINKVFLNRVASKYGIKHSENVFLVNLENDGEFSTNFKNMVDFGNVGASSLQILAALNYKKVVLVGVDARYTEIVCDEEDENGYVPIHNDPDHFASNYMGGRKRPARPDVKRLLGRWPQVAASCRELGIEVRNASPGSALNCFVTIDFSDALIWIGQR